MSVVDELEIELTANAKKANSAIDNLVTKLDLLSGSLSKIDGSRLSGLANGVAKLGLATKTLSGVKATDYNRIAKGFERFAKIDASKFSSLSSGLNLLAKGMNAIGSVQNLGNITPSINAIKNLARVDMSGFDTEKLKSIASTLSSFATQLSGVGKIEGSVTRLVSAMARLSSSGQYIGNVAMYFPELGDKVVELVGKLSRVGAIDANLAKLVDGIARLASAGKKAADSTKYMKSFGDAVHNLLTRLKHAPQINANIANTIQGLGNLASSGSRISTVTGNASSGTKRFGNALRSLKDRLQGAHKSSKGLASSIGMFYAKMFLVIRAVKKFGQAIGSAQDYIEEFNYFSVALDKIGKDSANQFKKAGYNSAEEYAKSFRTRFSKLQTQLTGYKVDYDTGDATSQMTHNLGLDLTEVMNFNAAIAQITNSAGMLGETSIMTSKALTMLSADWSSLSNQDLSDVMNNMQSALIGQSRAVYKYGIDITNAGLAQTALNHGIKVSIKDLDQQSKMQLRALTMLEQSKVAYGDLARTINQPANQLRMLRAGFQNLARTIGSLFMPIIQKIYPYLNAVVMVLQDFAQWVAKLAGIKLGDISGSVKTPETPDYSDAVDDSGKVADNMDKTAKKAKKASDNLQGFDVINKLQGSDNDGGGTDGGAGKGQGLDLSKELANALGNYEKIWDKAFKDNQNKAVQLANKIKKALIDGWKKGDFSDVGKAFAKKINGALAKIPWAKIKATTKKIAKSIATFLNGFIKKLNWKLVGKTLAEGFNTAVDTLYTFVTTFNWLTLGTSIADAINSAVKNADFKKAGKLLGAKLRGTIQFAFGLLTNLNYKQLGKKLGDAINGFFEDMGKVDKRTGLTGWQELGKSISDGIKGILDTIDTALSTVNWGEVGKAIGQFIGSIDWFGILGKVGKVIVNALMSAIKVALSAFANDPLGFAQAFISVATAIFAWKKLKALKTIFSTVFGKGISGGITSASGIEEALTAKLYKLRNNSKLANACSKIGNKIGGLIGKFMIAEMAIQVAGFTTDKLYKASGEDDTQMAKNLKDIYGKQGGSFAAALLSTVSGITGGDYHSTYGWNAKAGGDVSLDKAISSHKKYSDALEKLRQKMDELGVAALTQNKILRRTGKDLEKGIIGTKDVEKALGKEVDSVDKLKDKLGTDGIRSTKAFGDAQNKLKETMKKLNIPAERQGDLMITLNNAVDNGFISLSDYKKMAGKTYDSEKKLNEEIFKNIEGSKLYKDATDKLKTKMGELGTKEKEQTTILAKLKDNLYKGKISWTDYKKVVDGNYKSTNDLQNAINNLSSKSVKVGADVYGINNVKDLKASIGKLKNKEIAAIINPKLRKNWFKLVQKELFERTFTINAKTTTKGKITADALKSAGIKSEEGKSIDFKKLASLLKKVNGTWDNSGVLTVPKTASELIKYLNLKGIKYKTYAKGGFPEDGWFRASKGEYFGQFDDGTNYIANNRQIENGIAAEIAPAVHAAVKAGIREALSEMPMQSGGDVYLDGVKITKEVMSTAKKISKSTGTSWKMA